MLQGDVAVAEAVGRVAGAAPVVGSTFEASDVTMFETVFEFPMADGLAHVPSSLDMEFPATVRLFAWEWPQQPDDPGSPKNRLAGMRIMCRKGTVRMSWPLTAVFEGDPSTGGRLRAAGVPCVAGECRLDTYHDVGVMTVAGGFDAELRCRMSMLSEVHPHGLQWNIAHLACPLDGDAGSEMTLGLAAVQHGFSRLRTGRPVVDGRCVSLGGRTHPIGWAIGGLIAHGEVRIGPLEKTGLL